MADTELCGTRGQAHQYSKSMSINVSSTQMLVSKWASSKGRAFAHHIIIESISDWPDELYEPQAPSLSLVCTLESCKCSLLLYSTIITASAYMRPSVI